MTETSALVSLTHPFHRCAAAWEVRSAQLWSRIFQDARNRLGADGEVLVRGELFRKPRGKAARCASRIAVARHGRFNLDRRLRQHAISRAKERGDRQRLRTQCYPDDQVLQSGPHKWLLLELDREFIENIAKQAGFELKFEEQSRRVLLDLNADTRQVPLLLFDAADPANLGWFSRCQFYVDGSSGAVLQTPIQIANHRSDRQGEGSADFGAPADQQGTTSVVPHAQQSGGHGAGGVLGLIQFPASVDQHGRRRVRRNRGDGAAGRIGPQGSRN